MAECGYYSEANQKRRRRINTMTKWMGRAWILLVPIYAQWLGVLGYEAARWFGVVAAVIIGFAYPLMIMISIAARDTKPMPVTKGDHCENSRTISNADPPHAPP